MRPPPPRPLTSLFARRCACWSRRCRREALTSRLSRVARGAVRGLRSRSWWLVIRTRLASSSRCWPSAPRLWRPSACRWVLRSRISTRALLRDSRKFPGRVGLVFELKFIGSCIGYVSTMLPYSYKPRPMQPSACLQASMLRSVFDLAQLRENG